MDETWSERDLPVLRKIVEMLDDKAGELAVSELANSIDHDESVTVDADGVRRAVFALSSQYVQVAPGAEWFHAKITQAIPEAREAAGQWPSDRGRS